MKEMMKKSRIALEEIKKCTQEEVDNYCRVINKAVNDHAQELAEMAVKETGMGNVVHKLDKNTTMGSGVWLTMKNKKSIGLVDKDEEKGILYYAHPKGVVGSVAPTTNPTITPLGNAMLAIKGRNTIIISPHPGAKETSTKTVEYMNAALKEAGAPDNVIQIVEDPSIEATQELMATCDVVVATGGMGMVKAAYSSGKPAYGVGQGNVQTVIDEDYDNLKQAAEFIVIGRSFDNGLICACNQSVIVPENRAKEMKEDLETNGVVFFSDKSDIDKLRKIVFKDGKISPDVVGRSAAKIAKMAGFDVPEDTPALAVEVDAKGDEDLFCGEKLCPVLIFTKSKNFKDGVAIAKANLLYQGAGHSAVVHTNDDDKVNYAALEIPVNRLLVNVPGVAAGGGGLFTNLNPTPSLGCGSMGGNSISENLTYEHLIDISRVAYPRKGEPPTDEEIWAE